MLGTAPHIGQLLRAVVPTLAEMAAGTAPGDVCHRGDRRPDARADRRDSRSRPAMTSAHTVTPTGAGAEASAGTLPMQHAVGGTWRLGIGMWLRWLSSPPWCGWHWLGPTTSRRPRTASGSRPVGSHDPPEPRYSRSSSGSRRCGLHRVPVYRTTLMAHVTDQRPLVAVVSLGFIMATGDDARPDGSDPAVACSSGWVRRAARWVSTSSPNERTRTPGAGCQASSGVGYVVTAAPWSSSARGEETRRTGPLN